MDICLATTLTIDRLANLHRLSASWRGEISAAMLSFNISRDSSHGRSLLSLNDAMPAASNRMTLTLVANDPPDGPPYMADGMDRFPTNLLRNVAVAACSADRVLVVDVDFQFCCGSAHARLARIASNQTEALVVPAFEAKGPLQSRSQLARAIHVGEARGFHQAQWPPSHRCDDASGWLKRGERASVRPIRYTHLCEPYTVVHRRHAPPYDERFVGYGKNRVSHQYELAAAGVRFSLVPDVFLVHPSIPSDRHSDWWLGERCWPEFVHRVQRTYKFRQTSSAQRMLERDRRTCGPCSGNGLCLVRCRPTLVEMRPEGPPRRVEGHGSAWRSTHTPRRCRRVPHARTSPLD